MRRLLMEPCSTADSCVSTITLTPLPSRLELEPAGAQWQAIDVASASWHVLRCGCATVQGRRTVMQCQ